MCIRDRQKSWNKVLDLDPENREAISILSILGKQEVPKKVIKRKKTSKKRTGKTSKTHRAKKTEGPQLAISPRIATFTMVNVLKNQNLYHQALDVLDILVTKGADVEKVKTERAAIKELLKAEK